MGICIIQSLGILSRGLMQGIWCINVGGVKEQKTEWCISEIWMLY